MIDHWEALFDKTYLRWFHLEGKEVVAEIEKVERDVELTMRGGVKNKRSLVHFKGKKKPLVLNSTNARTIADIHGNKPSEWKGKKIVLFQSITQMFDKDLGKMVDRECIRIKEAK